MVWVEDLYEPLGTPRIRLGDSSNNGGVGPLCVLGSEEVPMDLSKSVFGFAGLRAEEVRIYEERFIMYSKWSFQFFHHPSSSFIVNNE